MDDSNFTQFVKKVLPDLKDDSDEDLNFILESKHNFESVQSATDNQIYHELAAGRHDWFYNLNYCLYWLSQLICE